MLDQRQWTRVTWSDFYPESIQKKKKWKRSPWCLWGRPTIRSQCWNPTVNQIAVLTQNICFSHGSSFLTSQMGLRPAGWSLGSVGTSCHPSNPPLPLCASSPPFFSFSSLYFSTTEENRYLFCFPLAPRRHYWPLEMVFIMLNVALCSMQALFTKEVVQRVLFSKYIQAVLIIPSTMSRD